MLIAGQLMPDYLEGFLCIAKCDLRSTQQAICQQRFDLIGAQIALFLFSIKTRNKPPATMSATRPNR